VRAEGIEPSRPCGLRIFVPLRLSPPRHAGSWSGLYLHHSPWGLGAARLVSTPSRKHFRAWLGIAISGFPDFEQFYAVGFPMGTQVLKSAASAISPRPREIGYCTIIQGIRKDLSLAGQAHASYLDASPYSLRENLVVKLLGFPTKAALLAIVRTASSRLVELLVLLAIRKS